MIILDNLGGPSLITMVLISDRQQKSEEEGGNVMMNIRDWSNVRGCYEPGSVGGHQKLEKVRKWIFPQSLQEESSLPLL